MSGADVVADEISDHGVGYHDRVLVVDPRTGIEVLGTIDDVGDDGVRVEPIGPGYPPGGFITKSEAVTEMVSGAGDGVDDYEERKRKEWDVTCMCLSGALGKLDTSTIDCISDMISEGHL